MQRTASAIFARTRHHSLRPDETMAKRRRRKKKDRNVEKENEQSKKFLYLVAAMLALAIVGFFVLRAVTTG